MKKYFFRITAFIAFSAISIFSFSQKLEIKENVFSPELEDNSIYFARYCTNFLYEGDTAKFNGPGKIFYFNSGSNIKEYKYNKDGLIELQMEHSANSSDNSSTRYEYDKFGNVITKENYLFFSNDIHSNTEIFENTYDDTLLISVKHYYINQSYYSAEIGGSTDTTYTKYFYDSLKRLEKEEKIFKKYSESNTTCEYYYNIKNLLRKIKIYKTSNNSVEKEICYTYDSNKNIVKREIKGSEEKVETYKYKSDKMVEKEYNDVLEFNTKNNIICKYTYDAHGNVLSYKKYDSNGKLISSVERTYMYLPK
ncbi:MAG TPA: hypothetical protein PKK00_01260 [Bacteroidales bacterium]|nr:hypothetical protein [Bacteroidales bacterium]HPS16054.1 hypothetical protein [Bacteroidales bacterium]